MSLRITDFRASVFLLSLAYGGLASGADVTLTDIIVWSNVDNSSNIIRVQVPGQTLVNPGSCSDPDSYFVSATLSQQTQSRTLAVLLTAKAMGRSVNVRVLGCESNRPAIVGASF